MIHIFCPRGSEGARDLVKALNELKKGIARRLRGPRDMGRYVKNGDFLVPWGVNVPNRQGCTILNRHPIFNKWEELAALRDKGVKTIPFSLTKRGATWVPRRSNHQGGSDLLHPGHADYWVEKVNATTEFRVHVLKDQVIRVGMKSPRPGMKAHAWIRSWDAGWRLIYDFDRKRVSEGVRTLAKAAVAALGLDFGAVDVGSGPGGPWVFEVNKAPGLEPASAKVYAAKLAALAGVTNVRG